jgi:hypothetical protein
VAIFTILRGTVAKKIKKATKIWGYFRTKTPQNGKKTWQFHGSIQNMATLPRFESPDMAIENFPVATLLVTRLRKKRRKQVFLPRGLSHDVNRTIKIEVTRKKTFSFQRFFKTVYTKNVLKRKPFTSHTARTEVH